MDSHRTTTEPERKQLLLYILDYESKPGDYLYHDLLADHELIIQLPMTKEGIRIVPGTGILLYHPSLSFVDDKGIRHGHPPIFENGEWRIFGRPTTEFYLTPEAADLAAGNKGKG